MSPHDIEEWPQIARDLDADEIEPLATIARRLSESNPSPSSRLRARLEARFAMLAPGPAWRPRAPARTAMGFAVPGVLLLGLAALGLAGLGPFAG